jgi:hypothetical protein
MYTRIHIHTHTHTCTHRHTHTMDTALSGTTKPRSLSLSLSPPPPPHPPTPSLPPSLSLSLSPPLPSPSPSPSPSLARSLAVTPAAQSKQTPMPGPKTPLFTGAVRPMHLIVPELPHLKARRDEQLDSLASLRLERDLLEAQFVLETQTKQRDLVDAQTELDAQTDREANRTHSRKYPLQRFSVVNILSATRCFF